MSLTDMPNRLIPHIFRIDSNRINMRGNLPCMNQLENWHNKEVIIMDISEFAYNEVSRGEGLRSKLRKEKAEELFIGETSVSRMDKITITEIVSLLFPKGIRAKNESNDVMIVFNAINDYRILVTSDGRSKRQPGGILGNAPKLHQKFGLLVMSDEEAVQFIRQSVKNRDDNARWVSRVTGQKLPEWAGQD